MSVGAADETEDDGGLANFDEDAAAENLAAVGEDVRPQEAEGAPSETGGVPLVGEPQNQAVTPGGPGTVSPPADGEAGYPGAPVFEPLGEAPGPPALTDDPAENNRRLVSWQRALTAHQGEIAKRQSAMGEFSAKVGAVRGAKEAQIASQRDEAVRLATKQAAERRERAQAAVDAAVNDRLEAKKNLESFKWERPHDGASIAALIFGAIGASQQDYAAALMGQPRNFENQGIKAINARMQRDYDAKKAKYAAAGDSLLMAKYGVKDAETAHRAQLNDLDADFSARYKRVAAEAEATLKQQGVPEAQAKGNALVTDALQKSAAHEEQIHDREEAHQIATEHNHATEAIARENMRNTRALRDSSKDDKRAAREDKEDAETVRNEKGNPVGRVPTGRGGAQGFATRDADYKRAEEKLRGLLEDIDKHGDRVTGLDETKRRNARYEDAVLGVATISPLGKTDEAKKTEAATLGSSGAVNLHDPLGYAAGANREAVQRKLDEVLRQREIYRQETLRPLKGEERIRSGGTESAPAGKTDKAAAPAAKSESVQAATLIDHLRTNPDDPRTPQIKAWLRQRGYVK